MSTSGPKKKKKKKKNKDKKKETEDQPSSSKHSSEKVLCLINLTEADQQPTKKQQ